MSNKIFSTYKAGKERGIKNNDRLIVEIGHNHVACIVVGGSSAKIEDVELFDMPADSFKAFEESFAYVVIGSRLLDKHYTDKKVFLNIPECVIVPTQFYSSSSSADFINVVFGEAPGDIFKDELKNSIDVINTYRLPVQIKEVIEKNLALVTVEHTYSNILRTDLLQGQSANTGFISLRFYPAHFIALVVSEGNLQLLHSYSYATTDDVLYHVVNMCKQFNLQGTALHVSGMVDAKFELYEQLGKYFPNLSLDEVNIPDIDLQDLPAHYFTPFFKLAE